MSYVDQDMTGNRIVSAVVTAVVMVALGWGLIIALNRDFVREVLEDTELIEIVEDEPEPEPDEPPPPEPEKQAEPPPIVAPPPPVQFNTPPPPVQTQVEVPENPVRTVTAEPVEDPGTAPEPPPPPPPPPPPQRANPEPRGNPGRWANSNDYPSRALREEREGVTRFRVVVNTKGRVDSCSIVRSSGHDDLDQATCKNIKRRARFRPALDSNGNPMQGTYSNAVRWQIPR